MHEFQVRLLRKEIIKAKSEKSTVEEKVTGKRNDLKEKLPLKCRASVILHSRIDLRLLREKKSSSLNDKLSRLSKEQDKPLFNIKNTVICYQLDSTPPKYALETLSLGPRHSILDNFQQNDVLAELDSIVKHFKDIKIDESVITDLNIKTLSYIKKIRKTKIFSTLKFNKTVPPTTKSVSSTL